MNHDERLTLLDLRADLTDFGDTDRRVERAILEGSEQADTMGNLTSIDGVHVAALRSGELADELRLREFCRIVDPIGLATLGTDHRLKLLESGTVLEVLLDRLLSGEGRTGDAREADHFHAEFEDEVLEVFGAFTLKEADGFQHFEARADGVAEGLIDISHQRHALAIERARHARDDAGQLLRLLEVADKGTVPPLHIDDEAFAAFGQLLRENAASDQRERGDGARLLTECVKNIVRWGNFRALLGHRTTDALELLTELVHRRLTLKPRDGAQLLDRRDTEFFVLTVHARHDDARGGTECPEHHGGLVTHAAGRNLGDLGLSQTIEVNDVAGETELLGEERSFLRGHLLKINCHRQGRLLCLGHLGIHDGVDDVSNLVGGEFAAIPLLLDERGEGGLLLTLVVQDFLCHKLLGL